MSLRSHNYRTFRSGSLNEIIQNTYTLTIYKPKILFIYYIRNNIY